MRTFFALASVVVLLLWIGLSIGRTATARYLHRVAEAYEAYYRPYANAPEKAPPAMWDFRRGEMVPLPPGSYEVNSDSSEVAQFSTIVVEEGITPAPFWVVGLAFGKSLLNISPLTFHTAFAALALFLAWIAWKVRSW